MALNKVDLPTFGKPTIPAFNDITAPHFLTYYIKKQLNIQLFYIVTAPPIPIGIPIKYQPIAIASRIKPIHTP